MEKNRPTGMIVSHPRSGLHLVRCGLYLLGGGKEEYDSYWPNHSEWGSKYKYFHSANEECVAAIKTPDIKCLLLVRNYHDLLVKSFAPMILRTYANIAPEAFLKLDPSIDLGRVTDDSLCDQDRFGCFAFENHTYTDLIRFYHYCPSNIKKKVVYYEDLISDEGKSLLKIADFFEINYNVRDFDYEKMKEKIKKLYVGSNHIPTPPELTHLTTSTHEGIENLVRSENMGVGPELYEKYLRRYKGGHTAYDDSTIRN